MKSLVFWKLILMRVKLNYWSKAFTTKVFSLKNILTAKLISWDTVAIENMDTNVPYPIDNWCVDVWMWVQYEEAMP